MISRRATLYLISILGLLSFPAAAQRHGRPAAYPAQPKDVVLRIEGRVPHQLALTSKDLRSYPRSTNKVGRSGGESSTYEGVALREILLKAGAPIGTGQDKEELRTVVEAISRDGTHVIFSLAELDPVVTDSELIVADTLNGTPFDQNAGLILVPACDKTALRSVRQLAIIRVRRLR